jgi:hypothetical protein
LGHLAHLLIFLREHAQKDHFYCEECYELCTNHAKSYSRLIAGFFRTPIDLINHKLRMHLKKIRCPGCQEEFGNFSDFKRQSHVKKHLGEEAPSGVGNMAPEEASKEVITEVYWPEVLKDLEKNNPVLYQLHSRDSNRLEKLAVIRTGKLQSRVNAASSNINSPPEALQGLSIASHSGPISHKPSARAPVEMNYDGTMSPEDLHADHVQRGNSAAYHEGPEYEHGLPAYDQWSGPSLRSYPETVAGPSRVDHSQQRFSGSNQPLVPSLQGVPFGILGASEMEATSYRVPAPSKMEIFRRSRDQLLECLGALEESERREAIASLDRDLSSHFPDSYFPDSYFLDGYFN